MRERPSLILAAGIVTAVAMLAPTSSSAQDVRRYIYAAVPGVSNYEQFGGVGILVFDADNGHKFVRRIRTWDTYRREAIEPIKGIAAHAATGRLYVSTTRRLAAFDLATEKVVWQKGYDADCCDRMAVSADGKTLYVPAFHLPKWYVRPDLDGTVRAGGQAQRNAPERRRFDSLFESKHLRRPYLPTVVRSDLRTTR